MVGAIPFEKRKMVGLITFIFMGLSAICSFMFYCMSQMEAQGFETIKGYLFLVGLVLVLISMVMVYMNWGSVERTKDKNAEKFVKERQEKS